MKIVVINGPNLNLLGQRETEIYGEQTLADLEERLGAIGRTLDIEVQCLQFNGEGQIVEAVHAAGETADGIIINPAAYTHYSIAIRDALAAVPVPVVEVHISRIYGRESFRAESMIAPVCVGGVWGFGPEGYEWALRALATSLQQ